MAHFRINDALHDMTPENKVAMAYRYAENKQDIQAQLGLETSRDQSLHRSNGVAVDYTRALNNACPEIPRDTYCHLKEGVSVTDSPGCMEAQAACEARLNAFCGSSSTTAFQGCVITRPYPDEHPNLYRWEPEADACDCDPACC